MRHSLLLAPLAMFALTVPAIAGGAECAKGSQAQLAANGKSAHKQCTSSKEDCVKYMQEAKTRGWVGIEYDKTEDGNMVVEKVLPNSPAEKAGLKAGDVLYALNGVEFSEANKDKLKVVKSSMKPGATIAYSVKRDGAPKTLSITLGTMPDEVYQAMVNEHLKEHTDVAAR
jgi:S1-C subfamily serine protease